LYDGTPLEGARLGNKQSGLQKGPLLLPMQPVSQMRLKALVLTGSMLMLQ
jgi:hypothetical protein